MTDAAAAAGVVLDISCGGAGTCGGCVLQLLDGAFTTIDGGPVAGDIPGKRVLGCRTRAVGDFRVGVPAHSLVSADEQVVVDFEHLPQWVLSPSVSKQHMTLTAPSLTDQTGDIERIQRHLAERGFDGRLEMTLAAMRQAPIACRGGEYAVTATIATASAGGLNRITRVEPGDTTDCLYGLAVDVGTTTVVCSLVDLLTGDIVDSASSYNQQVQLCADVAGRISQAAGPEGLARMRRLIVAETINRQIALLVDRRQIAAADIAAVSVAGNNVMIHLLLGVDPTHLGAVPFQAACNRPTGLTAGEVGLAVHPAATVDIAPATAAYIGGDITADRVACGLADTAEPTLLIDIGTNAEIVVGNRDRLIACAAPAGPAFEGQGLSCGIRASAGAIDAVEIDPDDFACRYTVIGGGAPVGLCGSALIDFVGQARKAGLLTAAGRYDRDAAAANGCDRIGRYASIDGGQPWAYTVVPVADTDDKLSPIVVTEADIAVLLQAKAVIYAGVQIALKHLGKSIDEIPHVFLAGGFARHLDLANAVGMGLLPDIPLNRYRFIGNGSVAGAYLRLVDHAFAEAMASVVARPEVIELNLDEEFQDAYTMAMFLP